MQNNESTLNAPSGEKPKKMTRAEFMVALDEVNATLEKNIAQARESQARTKASREKSEQLRKETREILRTL